MLLNAAGPVIDRQVITMEFVQLSIYDDEGPVHCHGFAWSTEETEITARYKANALYFVSMYDHMHNRGYVENIPGSSMCGCVEHVSVIRYLIY